MKIILLFFTVFFIIPHTAYTAGELPMRVHFIDVGQGDSMLIETPENQTILIDGGEPDSGERLVEYLREQKIEEIDLMIATHPDFDHIGGLIEVLEHFPVHTVLENGDLRATKTYAKYRLQLLKEEIPVKIAKENQRIQLDDKVGLHILHAIRDHAENANQSAIVLKLTYDTVDFLFMSDVEAAQEKEIAKKYDIETEILKVAHHGSSSSSSMKFLNEANPQVAIISYSMSNDYGHPVKRVIDNLMKIESQIFSTAVYGDIVVETDGKNYIVIPQMQPMERLIQRWSISG